MILTAGTNAGIKETKQFEISGLTPTAVPEPTTWAMMGLGFAALGYAGYRRKAKDGVAALV